MTHSIDLIDEEIIKVLHLEWLEHGAPLDFPNPVYIDWEDLCLQNGFTQ